MAKRGKVLINVNDIIGKRLGKLEVISYVGHRYDKTLGGDKMRHYYKVHCECGTDKVIQRGVTYEWDCSQLWLCKEERHNC